MAMPMQVVFTTDAYLGAPGDTGYGTGIWICCWICFYI